VLGGSAKNKDAGVIQLILHVILERIGKDLTVHGVHLEIIVQKETAGIIIMKQDVMQ
jgi:hypothetical protein